MCRSNDARLAKPSLMSEISFEDLSVSLVIPIQLLNVKEFSFLHLIFFSGLVHMNYGCTVVKQLNAMKHNNTSYCKNGLYCKNSTESKTYFQMESIISSVHICNKVTMSTQSE